MHRRRFFCALIPILSTLSGCAVRPFESRDGEIQAIVVVEAPDEATVVNYDDPRLDDLPLVREMVREAVRGGSTAREIDWGQAERLDKDLKEDLPYYRNTEMSGVYIRKEETVVVVTILFEG